MINYPLVENIASKNIIYLNIDAVLDEAIKLITEKSIRSIVVHDSDVNEYAYIGVDEIVHYIATNTDVKTPLTKLGLHPLIGIPKDYNIFEASYFFIENESLLGILNNDGTLFGVVSFIEILTASTKLNENTLDASVSSLVYKNSVIMSSKGATLNSLLNQLDIMPTDCIVVHEENIPLGIITERDIANKVAKNESLDCLVENCMTSPVHAISANVSIGEALNFINKHKHKRIFVVDDQEHLIGVITQKELISVIYHKFSHKAILSMDKLNSILEQKVSLKTEEISELKERYGYALEASTNGILDWNILTDQIVLTKKLTNMLKLEKKTCITMHQDFNPLIHPSDIKHFIEIRIQHLESGSEIYSCEYRILSDKDYIWIKDRSKIIYKNSQPIRVVSTISDITSYKKLQDKIKKQKDELIYQANHDMLTGLPNKVQFLSMLSNKILLSQSDNSSFALLFIDLDRFKEINDSLGHFVGDKVLHTISKKLQTIISEEQILSRFGGDEFVVMTSNIENKTDVSYIAQKIIDTMKDAVFIDNHTFFLSCSIGISLYPQNAKDGNDLLKQADAAMYKAKKEGSNLYSFYTTQMTQLAIEKMSLEADLHTAIANDEFEVYFQPQYNICSSQLIGLEALVRWNHPLKGIIAPCKFIPLAEQTGLIIELDQIVMKKAMMQVQHWYSKGYNPGVLALNLAMKQLQQENFLEILKTHMDAYSFKPEWLELEITESQIMQNPEESIVKLQAINELGIDIAIDDFGTGYSSLAYLKKLPVSKLKIDRSFITDIPYNDEDKTIVSAIISLANNLNLNIIAEGVENKEQLLFLQKNSCLDVQGYYYSKPIRAKEFEKILEV